MINTIKIILIKTNIINNLITLVTLSLSEGPSSWKLHFPFEHVFEEHSSFDVHRYLCGLPQYIYECSNKNLEYILSQCTIGVSSLKIQKLLKHLLDKHCESELQMLWVKYHWW